MSCIVYQTDKKTGAKYAYESVSYWDSISTTISTENGLNRTKFQLRQSIRMQS